MDTDQFQLRKITGHGVKGNGLANTPGAVFLGIDHGLTNLHLDGDIEFAAFCIERVVFGMIRCQFEPMWVHMGTDKTHIGNGIFKRPDTIHAFKRVDPGKTIKPIGVLGAGIGHN